MHSKFLKWYRRKRFMTAYRILRNESERHIKAGHDMRFSAINESHIEMTCYNCPDYGSD